MDAVTRGLLGMTVACARCHDHKFDPIANKDYEGSAGVFASTWLAKRSIVEMDALRARLDPVERITALAHKTLGRNPHAREVERALSLVAPRGAGDAGKPWEEYAQALLGTNEPSFRP